MTRFMHIMTRGLLGLIAALSMVLYACGGGTGTSGGFNDNGINNVDKGGGNQTCTQCDPNNKPQIDAQCQNLECDLTTCQWKITNKPDGISCSMTNRQQGQCINGFCGQCNNDGSCDANAGENCQSCPSDCGCPSGQTCYNSACCTPKTCSDLGWKCGNGSDGCGGTVSCGDCQQSYSCADHQCMPGCGNGKCDEGEDCQSCPSDCRCPSGQTCYNSACCTPKTCSDLGWECGNGSDGCGGTVSCGGCQQNYSCVNNQCQPIPPTCGDSKCDTNDGENCQTCKQDCGAGDGCSPGQTKSQPCGNCGTQTKTCDSSCSWGSWGSCTGEGECSPGQTGSSQNCGNCGTKVQKCNSSCQWEWGSCTGEGDCSPGQTGSSQDCGKCGTKVQKCNNYCQWEWGSCNGQGECSPGQTGSSQDCGNCGTKVQKCNNYCQWEWGSCNGQGECSSGQTQHQDCGNCGTKTRSCNGSCEWGSWGSCTGTGPCSPGQTASSQDCGSCGTKVQKCNNNCQWEWGTCEGDYSHDQGEYKNGKNDPVWATYLPSCKSDHDTDGGSLPKPGRIIPANDSDEFSVYLDSDYLFYTIDPYIKVHNNTGTKLSVSIYFMWGNGTFPNPGCSAGGPAKLISYSSDPWNGAHGCWAQSSSSTIELHMNGMTSTGTTGDKMLIIISSPEASCDGTYTFDYHM